MKTERGLQFEQSKEMLGHQIESKVADFMKGSFDCIDKIEKTFHGGVNDKKGIDIVITFEDGSRMAIDITSGTGWKVDKKIESMARSPLVGVEAEIGTDGETSIEKSKSLVPRGLIRANDKRWDEYNVETIDDEVIVYMPDNVRIAEEKDILQQLTKQIDYLARDNSEYKKSTLGIKKMLLSALEEVEKL